MAGYLPFDEMDLTTLYSKAWNSFVIHVYICVIVYRVSSGVVYLVLFIFQFSQELIFKMILCFSSPYT